jgi:hypothetical protein
LRRLTVGYCAECLTESIVTEGNSWDELRANVRDAVRGYYFDQPEKLAVRIASVWCVMKFLPRENPARPLRARGRQGTLQKATFYPVARSFQDKNGNC